MGASNQTSTGNREFFKLKEVEAECDFKGELRFFKQEKKGDKWADGETFNQLAGIVTEVKIKEYEYQGEKKKQLVIVLEEAADKMEFSLGLRSNTAQGILNTLAGENGFDLKFFCGRPKESKGKYYPTLWINTPDGGKTQWKYQVTDLPKVTTTTDEDGNKIKKGQKAADEFWMEVVKFVQDKLGKPVNAAPPKQQNDNPPPQSDDLPF